MKRISSNELRDRICEDPEWASQLTEPVEITDYCDMRETGITHLSPLLHFTGRNAEGDTASFQKCPNLIEAEGTFSGFVDFSYSGIEKIGDLNITHPNNEGIAAFFWDCKQLKVAEGTFPGFVHFSEAGIEKIGELNITEPDNDGQYLKAEGSPIEKNTAEMKSLVRKLFGTKPIAELREIQSKMGKDDTVLKHAIDERIRSMETAHRKNAAVEIQID